MGVQVSHFVRDTLIVVFGYLALVAAAWLGLGFGGALVAAIGAGALIALFLPLVCRVGGRLAGPLGLGGQRHRVASRPLIEPCGRFSRTRLTDIVHGWRTQAWVSPSLRGDGRPAGVPTRR